MMIVGDTRALRLLFENLIDNALRYAEGAPHIEVACTRSADHAVVRITDRGVGFSESEAALIFSGIRRGDTQRRGSGLGLRLSRSIARGHGGEVRLHSTGPHQGATAEVWLPLDDAWGEG
jgi:signal transduction histidine kinase